MNACAVPYRPRSGLPSPYLSLISSLASLSSSHSRSVLFKMLIQWVAFSLTTFGTLAIHVPGHLPPLQSTEITGFNWSAVQPDKHLIWHECYESFQCARLQVPLDWSNSSNPNTVSLALTRVPAVVPYNDPTFGGTILINPGGPGGSGVDEIIWGGYGMRDSIIDSTDKHFEVLSWDPRGIHHTTPSVACFGTDWDRQLWLYRNWAIGQLDSSENALDVKWGLYESLGRLCAQSSQGQFEDGTNMHQFTTTALTAQDMVAIIDALHEERYSRSKQDSFNRQTQHVLREHNRPPLLNYWGFSYGTFLGNTFASMFPDRIGRMILDGNVDPQDYAQTGWLSNLFDNPKNVHWFYYGCFHAGSQCALYDSKTNSLFDIERKVKQVLERLYHNPLPVIHDGTADIVTYSDLTNLIHGAAYAPNYFWPDVAQVIKDLSHDNGGSIVKYLKYLDVSQSPRPNTPNEGNIVLNNDSMPYPPDYPGGLEAAMSVLCGDGDPIDSLTKQDWQERLAYLKNQSVIAGPFWATIPFACTHRTSEIRPAERNRFKGPFGSKLNDYDERASPLLFIGNTADPVTPLRNAVANSKSHEGSAVLTQDSPGHCSGPVNPSQCTFEVIRSFFANGTLPEAGKMCVGDGSPWDGL